MIAAQVEMWPITSDPCFLALRAIVDAAPKFRAGARVMRLFFAPELVCLGASDVRCQAVTSAGACGYGGRWGVEGDDGAVSTWRVCGLHVRAARRGTLEVAA